MLGLFACVSFPIEEKKKQNDAVEDGRADEIWGIPGEADSRAP